jgi:hypothetical protein
VSNGDIDGSDCCAEIVTDVDTPVIGDEDNNQDTVHSDAILSGVEACGELVGGICRLDTTMNLLLLATHDVESTSYLGPYV